MIGIEPKLTDLTSSWSASENVSEVNTALVYKHCVTKAPKSMTLPPPLHNTSFYILNIFESIGLPGLLKICALISNNNEYLLVMVTQRYKLAK